MCLSTLAVGFNTGCVAGAVLYAVPELGLSAGAAGAVVAASQAGAVAGTTVAGVLAESRGPRVALLWADVLLAAGALAAALAPPSLWVLLAARALCGVGVGVAASLATLHVRECSPPELRGRLAGLPPTAITTGILLSYLAAAAVAPSWRIIFALGAVPPLAQLALRRSLPESPRWLRERGRLAEAGGVETRLGLSAPSVEGKSDVDTRPLGLKGALRRPDVRAALPVGILVNMFQQLSGINVVVYYAPLLLTRVGFGSIDALLLTAAIGACQVGTMLVVSRIMDRTGRRPLALGGLAVQLLSLGVLSVAFWPGLQASHGAALAWVAVAAIFTYRVAYASGLGPLPFVITAEVFPPEGRAIGVALSSTANWATNFAVSLTFAPLLVALEPLGLVWAPYALFTALALAYVWRSVPETSPRRRGEVPGPPAGSR